MLANYTYARIGPSMTRYQSALPPVRPIERADALAYDYALNGRDVMRAEIVKRNVALSRRKSTGSSYKRTGKAFEFGAHHLEGVIDLLCNLRRALNSQEPNLDPLENAAKDVARCETLRPFDGYGPNGDCDSKRRRGSGRHRSLAPEQIKQGIGILRSQPKMTIDAAHATLRDAGINGSRSALYRLVIAPAYASGSEQTPSAQSP
jgi:hypothetical protein